MPQTQTPQGGGLGFCNEARMKKTQLAASASLPNHCTPLVPLLQPVGLGGNVAGRASGKSLPLDGVARMPEKRTFVKEAVGS